MARNLSTFEKKLRMKAWNINNWSDLPQDILSSIVERLSFKEQIWFRTVCKNWSLVRHGIRSDDKLFPWIFQSNKGYLSKFYNPCSQESYKFKNQVLGNKSKVKVLAIKSSWLLIISEVASSNRKHIFMYNPFTQEVINLPGINIPASEKRKKVASNMVFTFRYCTKRRRFVVYGGIIKKKSQIISVIVWRNGEKSWRSNNLSLRKDEGEEYSNYKREGEEEEEDYNNDKEFEEIFKLVFIKGRLHCIFKSGIVAALGRKHWSVVLSFPIISKLFSDSKLIYCFECKEELFLVKYRVGRFTISKVDWCEMAWVSVDRFDKQALFLGLCGSALMVSVDDIRHGDLATNKDLKAGHIYYADGSKFYEFKYMGPLKDLRRQQDPPPPAIPAIWIEPPALSSKQSYNI